MEEKQKSFINSRFSDLCANTICRSEFLCYFYQEGILTYDEKQIIDSKITWTAKSEEFYIVIQKKANSFSKLLEALQKTNQTGALEILAAPRLTDEPKEMEVQKEVNGWLLTQENKSNLFGPNQ